MPRIRLAWIALVAAGLLALGRSVPAQSPPAPTQTPQVFRGGTTLVPVDIRVLDRDGKPVTDLHDTDFVVLENGVPQRIRHFSTQAYTPMAPGPQDVLKARTARADDIAPENRRVFL